MEKYNYDINFEEIKQKYEKKINPEDNDRWQYFLTEGDYFFPLERKFSDFGDDLQNLKDIIKQKENEKKFVNSEYVKRIDDLFIRYKNLENEFQEEHKYYGRMLLKLLCEYDDKHKKIEMKDQYKKICNEIIALRGKDYYKKEKKLILLFEDFFYLKNIILYS